MADPHDNDPVTAANQQISDFIQALGGRITPDARPEYERLLDRYFEALGHPRQARDDDGDMPLAA